ncbi:MAG: nucleotidyl transferase AbiEii/AbiGii toxin family protein [Prevotellaceae bacterium]|jgi:predicted nucleotidyltransferase component of viral defense system|nr:nucleotidyl transferase AbiEii/AbiGii toxin family protein [Prevotellaceae bacterium]
MVHPEQIQSFFPAQIRNSPAHRKYMLKEYIQLMILDYLSNTPFVRKIVFIGGTGLRLVKGIDRFSEDLDFDCKQLSETGFAEMADGVLAFLQSSGWRVEAREKAGSKLKAFRKNIYFPELLFELGLSGYREERFLIKLEGQDQGVEYAAVMANIRGCGFFFPFPVPPDDVLCAMKLSALLSRRKGRDFYDAMFLLAQTKPNYAYLTQKWNIRNWTELKEALLKTLEKVDLKKKSQDFEHLLFHGNSSKILLFGEFIEELKFES